MRLSILVLTISMSSPAAAQVMALERSMARLERGQTIELILSIKTDSALTNVSAVLRTPRGFKVVEPTPVIPRALAAGEHAFTFLARYPMFTPPFHRGQQTGRDVKFFADVGFTSSGVEGHLVPAVTVFYTTAILVYLVSAFLGLVAGFFVKKRVSQGRAGTGSGVGTDSRRVQPLEVAASNRNKFVTAMLLGLLVLLYLAKSGLPAVGFIDAFGLGAILGFAGDDALIAKLK